MTKNEVLLFGLGYIVLLLTTAAFMHWKLNRSEEMLTSKTGHMYQAYLTSAGATKLGRPYLAGMAVVFDEYTNLGNARNVYYCGRLLAAYLSFADSSRGKADLVKM